MRWRSVRRTKPGHRSLQTPRAGELKEIYAPVDAEGKDQKAKLAALSGHPLG